MNNEVVINTTRLTKYYGAQLGISEVDLAVNRGEVFGYLGPNGAGKTTTIRTLLDFIRPTGGSAAIFGLDARQSSVAIHRRIGYLNGELSLYDDMTGADLLRYLGNLRGGLDWKYVQELAARFQCDLPRRIQGLSLGNKQKLGLLQAFMHKPELLILDEPTNGLDPLMQHEFYDLLNETKKRGTHHFSFLAYPAGSGEGLRPRRHYPAGQTDYRRNHRIPQIALHPPTGNPFCRACSQRELCEYPRRARYYYPG